MKAKTLWIAALALAACDNPTANPMPDMTTVDVTLDKPASGFQLETGLLSVASGEEVQGCFFFKAPDLNGGMPYYVNRIEVAQNVGSHHMNIFRQATVLPPDAMNENVGLGADANGGGEVISKNGKGKCFYSANWADWPLVVNSQEASTTGTDGKQQNYVLDLTRNVKAGDNVAYKFTPGEILMLQSHWVNASTQSTPGRAKAYVNFYRVDNTANIQEVGTLFATKQSIAICRNDATPRFSGFCKMGGSKPLTIIAANGHFHSRGKTFVMNSWDGMSLDPAAGPQFYESIRWDEPPMATGLNVAVPSGGGVAWTCTYKWQASPACADGCSCIKPPAGRDPAECCYGFGGLVETSEHCNAFVFYYPKLENRSDIICM